MTVAAVVPTHHLPEASLPWMREAREIFDKLVVLIDSKRVTPGTIERAETISDAIFHNRGEDWYDPNRFVALREIEADWIFLLEYDEQLSPEWKAINWRSSFSDESITHFWFPRRWMISPERYVTSAPWWPDLQMRMWRHGMSGMRAPDKLHDPIQIEGRSGRLHLPIHHHALWLLSRRSREEKIRAYRRLRPGGELAHYYLYEDYDPPTAPLPPLVNVDGATESDCMDELSGEDITNISLRVDRPASIVRPTQLLFLTARVCNNSSRRLGLVGPHPVNISYHWLEHPSGQVAVFDGERTAIFPAIAAQSCAEIVVSVFTPTAPGRYILQITLVQEHVCWFETVQPNMMQQFVVEVD